MGEAEHVLNHMRRDIGELRSGKGAAFFQEMGLSAKDFAGANVEQSFEKLAEHIMKIGDPMQRARIEMEAFGPRVPRSNRCSRKMQERGGLRGFKSGFELNAADLEVLKGQKQVWKEDAPSFIEKKYAGLSRWVGDVFLDAAMGNYKDSASRLFGLSSGGPATSLVNAQADKLQGLKDAFAAGPTGVTNLAGLAVRGTQEAYTAAAGWKAGVQDPEQQKIELLTQIRDLMHGDN